VLLFCVRASLAAGRDGRGYWNRDKLNRQGAAPAKPGQNLFGEPVPEKKPVPVTAQSATPVAKVPPEQLYGALKSSSHALLEAGRTTLAGRKEPAQIQLLKTLEEFDASVVRANQALMSLYMLEGLGEGSSATFPGLDLDPRGAALQAAFGGVTGCDELRKSWVEQVLPALTGFMDRVHASTTPPSRRSESFRKLHGILD
jgi:hypothetical protein